MAEIDVQEKKKRSILPWLLLALGAIALIFLLTRNKDDDRGEMASNNTTNNGTNATMNNTSSNAAAAGNGWNIDWNAPAATFNEITGRNIQVRGNNDYSIYGLGEEVLFEKGQATLRSGAAQELQQIAASVKQRYDGGQIRVYGYTDATGGSGQNQQLSQQRAEAVKNWLVQNGGLNAGNVSVHAQGENNPVASNDTEQGRQQNRRVEIVARRS